MALCKRNSNSITVKRKLEKLKSQKKVSMMSTFSSQPKSIQNSYNSCFKQKCNTCYYMAVKGGESPIFKTEL